MSRIGAQPQVPHEALAFFAPGEAADGLPGAKIVPVRQEQLKERLKDRFRELLLGGDRHTYLSFRFLSCELATTPFERFSGSDNLVGRINLLNMHYSAEQKVDVYAQAVQGLLTLEDDPEKQLKYLDFIDFYADLDDNERARYEQEYPEEAEIMGTFSERYIQQGMERGEQLGVRKGEARVLLTQLQLKFGDVPESVRVAIDEADAETLLRWSTRVLTATKLDEVIADDR